MTRTHDMQEYLSGRVLVGDDFTPDEINAWFEDEREAYAGLINAAPKKYRYDYHALNVRHGFRHLDPGLRFEHACGFGSALGDELLPIRERLRKITVIDASRKFGDTLLGDVSANFVAAQPTGRIEVADGTFDLVTCFGVLHHIPNVSFVVGELARSLRRGGILLVREPITSMGDWRVPRAGLTPRERGLPKDLFRGILLRQGFEIRRSTYCVFPPLSGLCAKAGVSAYNYRALVWLDQVLCTLTAWNYQYHGHPFFSRFAPASEFHYCVRL